MQAIQTKALAARILAVAVLLALLASGVVTAPPVAHAQQASGPQLTVVTPVLNVRAGPGVAYALTSTLRQGSSVDIVGRNSATGWWQIKLPDGRQAWVSGSSDLVQVAGSTNSVPEAGAPAQSSTVVVAPAPAAGDVAHGIIVFQAVSGGPIYAINGNGTGLRHLTTGIDPSLSPDGHTVAFTRWQSATTGTPGSLYTINVDGTGERLVTDKLRQPKSPTWSPDGKHVVVNMQQGGQGSDQRICGHKLPPNGATDIDASFDSHGNPIMVCYTQPADPWWILSKVNMADGSVSNLASDNHAFSPTWNPTNNWQIDYHGRNGLSSMDANRDANWQVTSNADDRSPAYSPDGKKLAIAFHEQDHWDVYVMNPDGSGRTRLTNTTNGQGVPANNTAPAWSPDGSQIAFVTDRTGQWEIWVMNADGSNQRALFPAGTLNGITLQYNGVDERMLSWR
jgi:uncharacterized protein YraI